ncbi:MAG TPA: hypothetical protein VLL25_14750 [Acidimicrobiales bacterium]|nr:hypothetical protein [Acidimicrobiales bacterium]
MTAAVWTWRPRAECGTLRLELGDDMIDLMDEAASGLIVTDINLGGPAVREVTAALPTRDGNYDTTRLLGPRVVTITGNAVASALGSRQKALDNLARYCIAATRPRLVYTLSDDTAPRAVTLRASAWSAPYTIPDRSEVAVSWVAPDPVIYSLEIHDRWWQPEAPLGGRPYNMTFDRRYPQAFGGSGIATLINAGNYQTWPLLRIYGPCTDPAVYWQPPAVGAIVTTGLTVDRGDYLEVDTFEQAVTLNGLAGASRYDRLDFARTRWAPLAAGSTALRFSPGLFTEPCTILAEWADAWL